MAINRIERHLRVAALLVLLGLVIELITLTWNKPLAFLAFIAGAAIMALGVLFYLFSIVSPEPVQTGAPKA
jgi:energy-converting hydrogenase Eha subunit E